MARISLRGAWKSLVSRKIANRRLGKSDRLRRLRVEQLEGRDLFAYAPDPNFGQGGLVSFDFGSGNDGTAVAIQSDGKIIVAGNEGNASGSDFIILRYLTDGSPDNSFNVNGGTAITISGAQTSFLNSVAIQSDGKIVAGGTAQLSDTDADFALVRVDTIGHVDTTYSGDGQVTTSVGNKFDSLLAIAAQSDDKIVAVGYTQVGNGYDIAVVRYTTAGAPDTTFSGDGILTFGTGAATEYATGVAIQSDGKIVVAGTTQDSLGNNHPLILRYNTDGTPDTTFDGDGAAQLTFDASVVGIDLQADGKIVLAARSGTETLSDFAAIRLLANGAPDTSFSTDGLAVLDAGSKLDSPTAVLVQANSRIVVVGTQTTTTGNSNPAMVAFTTTGAVDTTFGTDGRVVVDFGQTTDTANAIAETSNGSLVVVGRSSFSSIVTVQFANTAPSITAFVVPTAGKEGQIAKFAATAADPNQVASTLSFSWSVTGPKGFHKTLTGATVNFKLPDNGRFTATLTVTNDLGIAAHKSRVIVVSNVAPRIATFSVPTSVRVNTSATFKATATDPARAADKLTYAWVITGLNFKKTLTGSTVHWTPTKAGKFTVTLTIRDGDGGKVSRAAKIAVVA